MKENHFQQRLRKEILMYSGALIAIITFVLAAIFIVFNRVSIDMQLDTTEATTRSLVTSSLQQYESQLMENRDSIYSAYLEQKINESSIYGNYYSFNSQQTLKGDLILLDSSLDIAFATNNKFDEDGVFKNYIHILADNLSDETEILQRLYMDRNRNHNLILMTPLDDNKGFAAYVIDGKEVRSQLNKIQAQFIISDRYDNVFSSSSSQFIKGSLEKVDRQLFDKKFSYKDAVYYAKRSQLTPDLYLTVYQQRLINPSYVTISSLVVLLLAVLLVVFAFVFSKRISYKNARSVELLSQEMKALKGDATKRLSIQTDDEFGIITDKINQMLEELSDSNRQNINLLKESMVAERKKLEAQFHPHFLYNTLEVIRAAILFDTALANQLILRLTTILRYSIEEKNTEITLKSDIDYLKEYLEISKARFQYFTYVIKLDEACKQLPVPKLFLLPLIENSLKYGFKHRQDLSISIEGEQRLDGTYVLRVIDNGQALELHKASQINHQLQRNQMLGNHHGLMNSKRRLQLMYPESRFELKVDEYFTIIEIEIGAKSDV